jgi:cytochrome c-type biogenesis protein CcmH
LIATIVLGLLFSAAPSDETVMNRVMALARDLRCLVCQNQTLADSQADLAVDLRNQITEMVRAGKTDRDIVNFLVERYGDFVLYRPPLKPRTYVLWFAPFAALLAGGWRLYRRIHLLSREEA